MSKDIESNMTIENAKSAADGLKKYIKTSENPVIDLTGMERIDLAGIQVLISAQKTGKKAGKPVYFSGLMKKNIYEKFSKNGFTTVHPDESDELYSIRRNSSEF